MTWSILILCMTHLQRVVVICNDLDHGHAEDENAVTFIEELQRRLAPQAPSLASSRVGELNYSYSSPNLGQSFPGEAASGFPPPHGLLGPLRGDNGAELFDTNDTPFELRVLEVALDVVRPFAVGALDAVNVLDVSSVLLETVSGTECEPCIVCKAVVRPARRFIVMSASWHCPQSSPATSPACMHKLTFLTPPLLLQIGGHLERQAADLEATAHPALDALTREVSTGSLERVRRVKSRMVRLKTRVETIREVLQKYLDDDSDMKDLHLSAKCDPLLSLSPRPHPSTLTHARMSLSTSRVGT